MMDRLKPLILDTCLFWSSTRRLRRQVKARQHNTYIAITCDYIWNREYCHEPNKGLYHGSYSSKILFYYIFLLKHCCVHDHEVLTTFIFITAIWAYINTSTFGGAWDTFSTVTSKLWRGAVYCRQRYGTLHRHTLDTVHVKGYWRYEAAKCAITPMNNLEIWN